MRAIPVNQTGTFGGNISTVAEVEDLKYENKNLRTDIKQLRD